MRIMILISFVTKDSTLATYKSFITSLISFHNLNNILATFKGSSKSLFSLLLGSIIVIIVSLYHSTISTKELTWNNQV